MNGKILIPGERDKGNQKVKRLQAKPRRRSLAEMGTRIQEGFA